MSKSDRMDIYGVSVRPRPNVSGQMGFRSNMYMKINKYVRISCVMQSDGNSFGGNVVLESFNMAWCEDSILDQL